MSNIDIFIRTLDGKREVMASLNNAAEVREMLVLLREVGIYTDDGRTDDIDLQAVLADGDVGFEFIANT